MSVRVAVIMSVYRGDSANDFKLALDSIFNQTYTMFDVFLQVDGKVSAEINLVIQTFQLNFERLFVEWTDTNKGLAWQLNRAISRAHGNAEYGYIARMDADDISHTERFALQIEYFEDNPNVAVVGSSVVEFGNGCVNFHKYMPEQHSLLEKRIIKSCPFNHPTVMFCLSRMKLSDICYDSELKNTQDYYLWVDLLSKGYKFGNIKRPLLHFRINENFHSRRGFKKALNDTRSRLYAMRKLSVFSFENILHTILLFLLRISPSFLKRWAYNHLR